MTAQTRGVLFVHSAPSALRPHIEWAVGAAFDIPISLDWTVQPVERSAYRAEFSWSGPVGTAGSLASALRDWQRIRYEVTEEPSAGAEGVRYSYTPSLGVFCAAIGQHGDLMVTENRIRQAMAADRLGRTNIAAALADLLGQAWDDELEPFRYASADTPVRWLHQVV